MNPSRLHRLMQALMHVHMNRLWRKAIDANQQTGDNMLLPDNPWPRGCLVGVEP
jgi:hypothetical protein